MYAVLDAGCAIPVQRSFYYLYLCIYRITVRYYQHIANCVTNNLCAQKAAVSCCGFDLCHKYILYLYLYLYFSARRNPVQRSSSALPARRLRAMPYSAYATLLRHALLTKI